MKEKNLNFEKLHVESEQAKYAVDQLNECPANQVVDILNKHPSGSKFVDQRGTGEGSMCDIRVLVFHIITTMAVNPVLMNKTAIWNSINYSAHNQESSYLFKTCVDLKIMDMEKSKSGILFYLLHPVFLDQIKITLRDPKFQKIQRWHFTRNNVFLPLQRPVAMSTTPKWQNACHQ